MAKRVQEKEICICAAIRLPSGKLIRGQRHGHCLGNMEAHGEDTHKAEQGFITSRNRFVSRVEGRELQDAAGIESVADGGYRGRTLYSEDLY